MLRLALTLPLLLLSGCILPVTKAEDGYTFHIDYEKIHNSIMCHTIDAWNAEYDYHGRTLPNDGTKWQATLKLNHKRSGSLGSSNTGSETSQIANWTKVLSGGLSPSAGASYEIVSSVETPIPNAVYTKESINRGPLVSSELVLNNDFENRCAEKYVNIDQVAIKSHFVNYMKGFDREYNGDRVRYYSNYNYEASFKIALSTDKSFKYVLAPYTASLIPKVSFDDLISVELTVKRLPYFVANKPAKPQDVNVTNDRLVVTGIVEVDNVVNVNIQNPRELACHISYVNDIENLDRCLSKKPPVTVSSLWPGGPRESYTQKELELLNKHSRSAPKPSLKPKRNSNALSSTSRRQDDQVISRPDIDERERLLRDQIDELGLR